MASGFVSSMVTRLFPGKGKAKSKHPGDHDNIQTLLDTSASPASAPGTQKDNSARTAKPNSRSPSTSAVTASPEGAVKKREQTKRKSPLLASLRKRTRPLSCFIARPDSPTETKEMLHTVDKSKEESMDRVQRGVDKKSSTSKQRKEKKPKRPLSCIVQPPSPRLPAMDRSPTLSKSRNTEEKTSPRRSESEDTRYAKGQQRPRPVSCYVELQQQRSPPPYSRRPQRSSPQPSGLLDQPAGFAGEALQPTPLSYSEAPRTSSPYNNMSRTQRDQPPSPHANTSLDSLPYCAKSPYQSLPYYTDYPEQPLPYTVETTQQPLPYTVETTQQPLPYYGEAPRQSTPVPERTENDRDTRYSPRPYPLPQACSGSRSYDLGSYFPSAAPTRRPLRPQSACFLCEPQPCCIEAMTSRRPVSQCYVPGCNLPWYGPQPVPREEQLIRSGYTSPAEADQAPYSAQPSPVPKPRSASYVTKPESSPTASPRGISPAPRAAELTPAPRPKSGCLLSTESESSLAVSPLGDSPVPSPLPRRPVLQKYRSAECLDRVDELERLDFSPPPAKPLSYFTDSEDQQLRQDKKHDEIYTSAEMLEKLGQPRSRSRQPGCRPVSCFVGSPDESGYLSNATLGGSGWLGGLSASTGDILEILDGDELNVADDELSFERASSFRKAWSVCSLLRQDSIQDRSFTVMRKRRQKMKNRRQTNQRFSSTETDEGVDLKGGNSTSSLIDDDGKGTIANFQFDDMLQVPMKSRGRVTRLHSVHMKAWEIRLRRKQMLMKKRSNERLHPRIETLV